MTPADRSGRALDVEIDLSIDGAGGRWEARGAAERIELAAPDLPLTRLAGVARPFRSALRPLDGALRRAGLTLHVVRAERRIATLGIERPGERRWPALAAWLDRVTRVAPVRAAWFGGGRP